MVKVLICGGGNGAHAMAGIAGDQPDTTVHVLTIFTDEAERWTNTMKDSPYQVLRHKSDGTNQYVGKKPTLVTKDPVVAMKGIDIIVIICPSYAHMPYLMVLKPYVKPGLVVAGLPGSAGFEFAIHGAWGDKAKGVTILSFDTLPWACRIIEYGKCVEVLGTKGALSGASIGGSASSTEAATAMLQKCLGPLPKITVSGHVLGITLMGVNGYVHPATMYGQWINWDGKPLDEPPPIYTGLTRLGADLLSQASDEVVATAKAIMKQCPQIDLNNVIHIYDWYMKCYSEEMSDKSDLYSAIRTTKAYTGMCHPTIKTTDGKYLPNFEYRYMTEDIPFGLVVMRGIAEVAGVHTPGMDKIIYWAQGIMGKEYLKDGKLAGKDISETRSPQRFNLTTLNAVLGLNA